jgi:hypothetical protein
MYHATGLKTNVYGMNVSVKNGNETNILDQPVHTDGLLITNTGATELHNCLTVINQFMNALSSV